MSKILWSSDDLTLRIVQTDTKDVTAPNGLAVVLECSSATDAMGARKYDAIETLSVHCLRPLVSWCMKLSASQAAVAQAAPAAVAAVAAADAASAKTKASK